MKGIWSGDVNLNDGELEKQYKEYQDRLSLIMRFMEAVYDDAAKLSYQALIGTRRQSVSDVEQIFSSRVLEFFERKGYTIEAEYVRMIRDWRRACDERGLTNAQ